MTMKWQTVAEAAATLGVSPETVRRRAKRRKLESRQGPAGCMEVRVHVPEPRPDATPEAAPQAADEPGSSAQGEAAGPHSARFGRYSPLPEAMTEQIAAEPQRSPWSARSTAKLTPGELLRNEGKSEEGQAEDELTRYQRLAGASVILAQRQADEANEKVAVARNQAHHLRKLCYTSWAGMAVMAAACLILLVMLGSRANRARADLTSQHQLTQQARLEAKLARDELTVLTREHGVVTGKLEAALAQAEASRADAQAKAAALAKLQTQKEQTDAALQAALASLQELRGQGQLSTAAVETE